MREIEFLPDWYPQIRRRRRVVILQAWITAIVLAALGLWITLANRNVAAAEATLLSIDQELSHSREELKEVEILETLNRKLGEQARVLAKVGPHVESARLLATLDEVMPKSMSLLEVSFVTQETKPLTLADVRVAQEKDRPLQRRLDVRIVGVSPTDVEVAEFLTRLTGRPFFESVRMNRSKPRVDNGRIMREFEVLFTMDLSDATGT